MERRKKRKKEKRKRNRKKEKENRSKKIKREKRRKEDDQKKTNKPKKNQIFIFLVPTSSVPPTANELKRSRVDQPSLLNKAHSVMLLPKQKNESKDDSSTRLLKPGLNFSMPASV